MTLQSVELRTCSNGDLRKTPACWQPVKNKMLPIWSFFSFLKCCFGQTCLWLKRRNRKVPKTTSTNSSSSVSRIRSGARIRAKFWTSLSDASIADTGSARQIWPNSSSTFSTAAKPSHSRYLTDPVVTINSLLSSQLWVSTSCHYYNYISLKSEQLWKRLLWEARYACLKK